MLRAGLVDELRLVVAPSVVGHGRRVFEGDDVQSWKLLGNRTGKERHVVPGLQPLRQRSPPG
ncbi:dihydrofolate reductase family protein [Microbispora sp. CA-135349]|uniref:dihydrofolate reductase family protein n=1 Tax=Microbispora sp. CA-135349 TaxID=3239953 RepID=UPI003D8E9669